MNNHSRDAAGQGRTPKPAPRLARIAAAGAAVVCAGFFATACSSGSGGQPGVANLPGHPGGAAAPGRLTVAQSDREMISFTRCMRSHGVQMSDPYHRPGHSGLSMDLPTLTGLARIAYNACVHLIQPLINMKAAAPSVSAAHLAALTRYAQCMRGHDIAMLDPTGFGGLNLGHVPGITSNFGRYTPQFRAADAACRHLLPAGVHDDGTGP